ncbi:MobF family relaxase [Sphaerisporangium sp. NPDC005289]|uniref:MobF family relaxase n=1 Tax=Sphaerisporangium sp. NPDC005289 TaxID=3155247 RepID=UPI0033BF02C5
MARPAKPTIIGVVALMTTHKLTAGDGYTYLTRQVAGGDVQWERGQSAAEYYTAKGNPPGRWTGRGAALLGLDGQQVSEDQMQALYGAGMHPRADAIIQRHLAEHLRADMTERQLDALQDAAIRAATLGSRFPVYQPLEQFTRRVGKRLEVIEQQTGRAATQAEVSRVQAEESRRARAAVAGFDVVFAPVKSAALLWALDTRPHVRQAVRHAHEAARDAAMEMLEQHAAFTRTGKGGLAQIETHGLIAAMFDHYDSRAGDPNLHTHVAISSKVQGVDGKWRSLDARALYRITVAASEFYNTAFETELRRRIPVTFTARSDTRDQREPIWEITGIGLEFIEFFSSRRTDIEARYEQLLRRFRREHGHDPNRQIAHRLARQANLETRDAKKTPRSLQEMRADWAQSFTERFGPGAIGRLMSAVPDGPPRASAAASDVDIAVLAATVVAGVSQMRSTWTVWNLRAEAERLVRAEVVLDGPEQHQALVTRVVESCLSPSLCLPVDRAGPLTEPEPLRRSDGSSVFVEHAATRFTSRLILDAEQRLVAAATTSTWVEVTGAQVAAALRAFDADGVTLDAGQRRLVTTFATDDRLVVAGLGPAGAGKTTAMRAYAHVAAQAGQRLVALATSSAASDVLGRELGVRAENLHKFVHEHTSGRHAAQLRAGQPVPEQARMFALGPGDVVLLDEAGMAGTLTLDKLVQIAASRGAVVRLLGDHRQLGAVESGGALRLIATEAGAVELTTLYRFNDPAEAEATLKIRLGDSTGLDFYLAQNRIRSGSRQAMIEEAYASWKADMLAGRTTLMAAATGVNVTALAAQARLDRIEAGQVETEGIALHDGNRAGAGDWIVTRRNDRTLRVHRGKDWVKNGDAWSVQARHRDGSLTVQHLEHRASVRLPADYAAANVELLYATTTNRAQGSTVDTAHPLITSEMSRENLYVVLSRARHRTVLHVVTHELLAYDPDDRLDRVRHDARQYAAREILHNIISREGNEISATETIQRAADDARSLATLVPRRQHAATLLAQHTYTDLAHQTLPRPLAQAITGCDAWPSAVTALTQAEARGWPVRHLLAVTARDDDLLTAETPGRLLAWRIRDHVESHPAPPQAAPESTLLPWLITGRYIGEGDPQLVRYVAEADELISARVRHLTGITISTRPVWSTPLGSAPADSHQRHQWERHLGVVAAYRDQQKVTTDDPNQILGSYPGPGGPEHSAYWHAVDSIVAARTIAGLERPRPAVPNSTQLQEAAEAYLALPDDSRAAVQTDLARRRGALWFGDRHSINDHAVTRPVYTQDLRQILLERGHLSAPSTTIAQRAAEPSQGAPTTEPQPVEVESAIQRRAQRDAEREARKERARLSSQAAQARRSRQEQRAQQRRRHVHRAQPSQQLQAPAPQLDQRQERRLGR